jgi:hypothetical protein
MRPRSFLFTIAVSVALTGCAHPAGPATPVTSTNVVAPTLTGDPAHPRQTSGWVDTKLYFGLGPADRPEKGISEAHWRDFLDKEVTPRFPDGLSVVDVYGQWGAEEPRAGAPKVQAADCGLSGLPGEPRQSRSDSFGLEACNRRFVCPTGHPARRRFVLSISRRAEKNSG